MSLVKPTGPQHSLLSPCPEKARSPRWRPWRAALTAVRGTTFTEEMGCSEVITGAWFLTCTNPVPGDLSFSCCQTRGPTGGGSKAGELPRVHQDGL